MSDAHSRLAYSKLLTDEREDTAADFWLRAITKFNEMWVHRTECVDRQRLMLSVPHIPRRSRGIEHRRTRPHRPETNGNVERFYRTLADELAYPGSTSVTQTAARNSRAGGTSIIITAVTPRSEANHQPAAYLTSRSVRLIMPRRGCDSSPRRRIGQSPGARVTAHDVTLDRDSNSRSNCIGFG